MQSCCGIHELQHVRVFGCLRVSAGVCGCLWACTHCPACIRSDPKLGSFATERRSSTEPFARPRFGLCGPGTGGWHHRCTFIRLSDIIHGYLFKWTGTSKPLAPRPNTNPNAATLGLQCIPTLPISTPTRNTPRAAQTCSTEATSSRFVRVLILISPPNCTASKLSLCTPKHMLTHTHLQVVMTATPQMFCSGRCKPNIHRHDALSVHTVHTACVTHRHCCYPACLSPAHSHAMLFGMPETRKRSAHGSCHPPPLLQTRTSLPRCSTIYMLLLPLVWLFPLRKGSMVATWR